MELAKDPLAQSLGLFGNGLDESDVTIFVNSLLEQNSDLAARLEQAESLLELAIREASDAARQIEQSKITDKAIAEQQAGSIFKAAQEKARLILKDADDQASKIIKEARQKAEQASRQAKDIIASAETKARDIKSLAESEASKIALELKIRAEKEASLIKQAAKQVPEKNKWVENKVELQEALATNVSRLKEQEDKKPAQASAQEETERKEQVTLYSGAIELELPPPISMNPLRDLARFLKGTRYIEVLSLNTTPNHGLKIKIFLHKPLPLINILKSLPQVEKVSRESIKGRKPSDQSGNGGIVVKMRS